MSWLAPKMRNRIQIWRGVQAPNSENYGFDKTYIKLIRLWAHLQHVRTGNVAGFHPIRGTNDEIYESHQFTVRYSSIVGKRSNAFADGFGSGFNSYGSKGLGRQFTEAFSTAFDSIIDMNPIKADYFVFLERENQWTGKLFRITKIITDEGHRNTVIIKCMEQEERGTGFAE